MNASLLWDTCIELCASIILLFAQEHSLTVVTVKLWKVWTQESFQKVEFDRPGERSPE